jgi:hypothetical protein
VWAPLHVVPGALAAWAQRRWGMAEWHHPLLLAGCAAVVAVVDWTIWQHLRPAGPTLAAADAGEPR